jgi:collagenase-like PrtC family protease
MLCYFALQDLADISYLLSPQDLMALQQVPAMIAAGVGCFKIEGRLKGPEYVAATTAAYRAGAHFSRRSEQHTAMMRGVMSAG